MFAVILELLRPFSPPLLSKPIKNFVMLSTVTIDWSMNSFLAKAQVQCKRSSLKATKGMHQIAASTHSLSMRSHTKAVW